MTDSRMEQIVGNLLRTGVALAAAVVLAGGIWYLATLSVSPDYHHFHVGRRSMPFTQGLTAPLVTIEIGLLLLIATPVARVVFSLVAFWLEGDRVYVGITLTVLAILAYSLVWS